MSKGGRWLITEGLREAGLADDGKVVFEKPFGSDLESFRRLFTTEHRGAEIKTVELLKLERPRVIRYEWLDGPLDEVSEVISFDELNAARTRLRYQGTFRFRRGPVAWVIARLKVKPLFDRLVREHLGQAKEIAERRAARSRLYPEETKGVTGDR